jgi:hypothetical protein
MKRPASKPYLIAVLILFAALAVASLPSAAAAGDRDCPSFSSQRAAQFFYLRHGGPRYDPHRLDADDDGVACEDNPCPCYFKKHLPRRANPAPGLADRLRRGAPGG